MDELKKRIAGQLRGQKFGKDSLLILILAGLLLLVIAWPTNTSGEKKKENGIKSEQSDSEESMPDIQTRAGSADDYGAELETRLAGLLGEMEGVGDVRVMVTFSASCEEIPLKDVTRTDKDTTEADGTGGMRVINESGFEEATIYVTDAQGERTPYIVRTVKPQVIGVAVIAEGGGNPNVQKNITAVIQSLFRIDANRIIVTKMKS